MASEDRAEYDRASYRRQHAVGLVGFSALSALAYAAGHDFLGFLTAFGAFVGFMGLVWDAVLSGVGGGWGD